MGTVIVGGGIIGISIAYYLSETSDDPSSIHIVESSSKLFASASGFAAGFIAKDWFSSAAAELGALSFELHKKLAKEHNGSEHWGYAPSTALSLAIQRANGDETGERGEDWLLAGTSRARVSAGKDMVNEDGSPAWLTRRDGDSLDVISSQDGCAQVDPLRLCEFMLDACRARGVQVHCPARVVSLSKDEDSTVVGVNLVSKNSGDVPTDIVCKSIVIASGAWTPAVFKELFPRSTISIPISPLAGYSLIIRSPRHSLLEEKKYGKSHAIFSAPTKDFSWAPEIFSRKGGDIYIAGLNNPTLPLPENATGAIIEDVRMAELKKVAAHLMGRVSSREDRIVKDDLVVTREALCFRPVSKRGTPIVAKVPNSELSKDMNISEEGGVFIAAGHGPWGISLSLATGKVISEMIRQERTSADVSQLGV